MPPAIEDSHGSSPATGGGTRLGEAQIWTAATRGDSGEEDRPMASALQEQPGKLQLGEAPIRKAAERRRFGETGTDPDPDGSAETASALSPHREGSCHRSFSPLRRGRGRRPRGRRGGRAAASRRTRGREGIGCRTVK